MPPAKGGEVMPADQGLGGLLHSRHIQSLADREREPLAEWTRRTVPDAVAVLPEPGRLTRLEPRRHSPDGPDRDVPGEHRPQ